MAERICPVTGEGCKENCEPDECIIDLLIHRKNTILPRKNEINLDQRLSAASPQAKKKALEIINELNL